MTFDFDLVDLDLLVNVADTQGLVRGAERSHISAPAASARIKKVEEALGTQLFYRTTGGLSPTPAGQTFLQHARVVLQKAELLSNALCKDSKGVKGNIRVFANTLSISEFVPPALRAMLLDFPEVNIDLHERASEDIARALKLGAADIGIMSADVSLEGLQYLPYRTERLVLIVPKGHPLDDHGPVDFCRTRDDKYIGLKESASLTVFIVKAAARLGISLNLRIQVNNFEALCDLVESGVGVGLIPQSVATRHARKLGISIVQLTDDWAIRDLKIAVRDMSALSVPARALIDILVDTDLS
jgi:DNA-binding transcriptional LysR family regulator